MFFYSSSNKKRLGLVLLIFVLQQSWLSTKRSHKFALMVAHFFAILILMAISSVEGLTVPFVFLLGTSLPVILFAFVIAFSMEKMAKYFKVIQKLEKGMRIVAGITLCLPCFIILIFIGKYFDLL